MSYTGILLRGDTLSVIHSDPPVVRELTWAGEYLSGGSVSGTVYYLNTAVLAKLAAVDPATGAVTPGVKTSDLPITFDGAGFIQEAGAHMLVKGAHEWVYEALAAVDAIDDTTMEFAGITLQVGEL